MLNIKDLTYYHKMFEPQTLITGDISPKRTYVSSGDNVDKDNKNFERELLEENDETNEPKTADMYFVLQEF